MLALIRREPALSAALVQVVILVVERFGFRLDATTMTALAATEAAILGVQVRSKVTPVDPGA